MLLPIKKKKLGFSLIEVLVAGVIFAGISLLGVQLLWNTLSARSKQYTIEGSSDNVRLLLSGLTKAIQSAKSVNIIDPWTIQITSNSPDPCRTILLDNSQKIVQALETSDPCTPPSPTSPGLTLTPIVKEEIFVNNKTSSVPLFSPTGNNSKLVNIKIEGIYKDTLGEHPFNFETTVSPRITI